MKSPLLTILLVTLASVAIAAPQYTIVTFNEIGNYDNSYAYGMNANGDVVGSAQAINGVSAWVPFLYSASGGLVELSPANGFDEAFAINDNGYIVGRIDFLPSAYAGGGVWNDISGGDGGDVYAVNNSNVAVGAQYGSGGNFQAVIYSGGTVTFLGSLMGTEGDSDAHAINDHGVVVGDSDTEEGTYRAVIFHEGIVQDLGTLEGDPGHYSVALDINTHGQIVGWSDTSESIHAFLWEDGVMYDLGVLSGYEYSEAYGLNNHGQVVGIAATFDGSENTGFYYDGTTTWNLADLVVGGLESAGISYIFDARDINDAGQIFGNAFDLEGNRVGFILVPVPEPALMSLLLCIGVLTWVRFHSIGCPNPISCPSKS